MALQVCFKDVLFSGQVGCLLSPFFSNVYAIVMFIASVEYVVEAYLYEDMKTCFWVGLLGVLMILGGEIIRKTGTFQATVFLSSISFLVLPLSCFPFLFSFR